MRVFIGGFFYIVGLMIRSYKSGGGEGVSKNAFSNNMNTANLKIFPNPGEIYTGRESINDFVELWKD